ncbi:hypothetical protein DINM_004381 [Dirofilaria immitis]|nr:hypothetical protein [Dirofilaria immitis]
MQQLDQYLIESSVIALPGCRDRSGSPLLFINFMGDSSKQSSMETFFTPNYEELASVIRYLSQIPVENVRKLGFTIVIDGRKAMVKHIRGALRACQQALYQRIRFVLVIQPEKFFDQQRLNFELIKEAYQFKCTLISLFKLSRFVDVTQLPDILGGNLHYDPYSWILLRQFDENTLKDDGFKSNELLRAGYDLLDELMQNSGMKTVKKSINGDWDNAAQRVDLLIKQIKDIKEKPETVVHREERSAMLKLLENHNEGVHNLVKWILNAGERWLLTLHEIGESYDDAKQILKEHNKLESKSMDLEEQSRELVAVGHELQNEFPKYVVVLQQNIDEVQQLVHAFCTRVMYQKKIALRSFSRRTNSLLESLCTNVKAVDIATAEKERNEMENKVDEMEKVYRDLITSGISFIDELCIDESNSVDRSITHDYSTGIIHIRLQRNIGRITWSKTTLSEFSGCSQTKIHQFLQLYTCEKDGLQAILWIEELYETLVNEYNHTLYDLRQLHLVQGNTLKLEETARASEFFIKKRFY